MLMIKKNSLLILKTLRNTSIFSTLLASPFYGSMLQNYMISNNAYSVEDILKFTISMGTLLGISGSLQCISNKYLNDCITIKNIMDIAKIERKESYDFMDIKDMAEDPERRSK